MNSRNTAAVGNAHRRSVKQTELLVTLSVCALIVLAVGASVASADAARLDLNTATMEQLTALPGIGPAKAAAIVHEREKSRFRSVDDLSRVSGIGEKTLVELRAHVKVAPESTKP